MIIERQHALVCRARLFTSPAVRPTWPSLHPSLCGTGRPILHL